MTAAIHVQPGPEAGLQQLPANRCLTSSARVGVASCAAWAAQAAC